MYIVYICVQVYSIFNSCLSATRNSLGIDLQILKARNILQNTFHLNKVLKIAAQNSYKFQDA